MKDRVRTGPPRVTSKRQDRLLKRLSLSNRKAISKGLKREFAGCTGTVVCSSTIRRRLLESGLKGCVARKKPLRTNAHKKKRLQWCKERKNWTDEQWGRMLFSDESIYEMIPGRRAFVRRRVGEEYNPECLVSTVKHGDGKSTYGDAWKPVGLERSRL